MANHRVMQRPNFRLALLTDGRYALEWTYPSSFEQKNCVRKDHLKGVCMVMTHISYLFLHFFEHAKMIFPQALCW